MAPKNKKGQKVLLTDFLADTSTGRSWADEMDELPTAPAPRDPNEPSNAGLGGSHLTRGDGNRYGDRDRRGGDREYMDRPSRVEIPIPDKPPFNAFVGNLSWEVGSTELEEFFGASHIISIRLITDSATGKPKGYGYVEFDEREALVAATDKSGRELGGRPVRVSVAEPPKEREDRTGGAWRREGPLPTFEDNRRTRHSSHQERSSLDDVDRGERMGFGSKFVPSTNTATNLTRRTQSGRGFSRGDGGFGFESEGGDRGERMGFGSKFVASVDEPRKDREPPLRGGHFVPSRATPVGSDDGHSASGGSIRRAPQMERKNTDIEPTAADTVSNWRRAKPAAPSEPEPSPAVPPTAPPTRRKLELSARTVTSSDGTSTPPTSVVTNKPSPFGAAKPIDSTEREKAIQEKLDRERTELSVANSPKPAASLDEKSTSEGEPKASPSVTTSAAPKAPKPNPFGAAKPVDTLQKELEVEQKLEREKAEKLKKEAQEAKAAPPVSTKQPAKGPSNAIEPPNPTTTSSANQPAHPPTAPATQPRSRWTTQPPPISKPATNGNAAPPAITTTAAAAPAPAPAPAPASKAAASPLSPSLSSFRKEGISFAALAKTAAANSSSSPATTAGPKGSAKEEQLHKAVAQHPRTILKRVEGLEIKNE